MSILPLPQYGQVEAAKNMHQSDYYRSASASSIWLGAHIKSIANVKIIFPSSNISLVQENIVDNVHMHLLTKLLCRKRHKKTKDAESKEEMNLIMCNTCAIIGAHIRTPLLIMGSTGLFVFCIFWV